MAAQEAALRRAMRDSNMPAMKRLLADDAYLPSQANVRQTLANGIFSIRVYIHVYIYYKNLHTSLSVHIHYI